ncbi:MAG: GntR family transcriptional regulator [Planctomycetes bacterium]|nr:GntR family transcriptional regulator [Planctomycetota bacterium]
MTTNSTLGERVHAIIRQDILSGRYRPGERLFFETIAREVGVSMTPIKEAFMLLEKEGLVVTAARKGTFVREFTRQDILEFYQIRLALESLAVDLICGAGLTAAAESRFGAICDSLQRHIDLEDATGCVVDDVDFHTHLAQASGNGQLLVLVNSLPLTNLFNLVRKAEFYLQHGQKFLAEHRRIVRLLGKGDAARIKEILRRHITTGDHSILVAMDANGYDRLRR